MSRSRAALFVLVVAALFYLISVCPAQVLRLSPGQHKLSVPANITRGIPFEVTYRYKPDRKGQSYLYAMYGLDKDHVDRYPALGFPAFIHSDGSPDQGIALPLIDSDAQEVAEFTWTLLLPNSDADSMGKYLDGKAILGVALYGVRGIRMLPIIAHANATTFVSGE
ncbi:hypothetical protein BCV69DRAFT_299957 [Microstroma glucosiphilum]|uniref:DUF1775-domain-containing protein n=1 Tax=Pseudomicrostroma glucosiphilum TaxID=1684307 RepID=A0A316U4D7_9BASI|nr:hypothetical protein BCV69DRAFT_299957 [Pseudomicrostroma glucosiphilum]PWN19644.1 hypothetical protein BCV69DRAFT_299957 [Pseudomicrostroma glucosiphilum]